LDAGGVISEVCWSWKLAEMVSLMGFCHGAARLWSLRVWSDGYKLRYDKNITLCFAPARTRRAHEQHQRSHYYTSPLWHHPCAKLYNNVGKAIITYFDGL